SARRRAGDGAGRRPGHGRAVAGAGADVRAGGADAARGAAQDGRAGSLGRGGLMKIRYDSWRPSPEARIDIARAEAVCRQYAADGYDLTLRQLYYQFVA